MAFFAVKTIKAKLSISARMKTVIRDKKINSHTTSTMF